MLGQPGHNTRLHAQLPPSFLVMDACTTSQLNVVLVCKLLSAWFIFDTLSISVCSTSHRQTSGQLVQELNVCTVYSQCQEPRQQLRNDLDIFCGQNSCQFLAKTRHWSMPNELGLNQLTTVIRLFGEYMKTIKEHIKKLFTEPLRTY